jgi:hypothetical protein
MLAMFAKLPPKHVEESGPTVRVPTDIVEGMIKLLTIKR